MDANHSPAPAITLNNILEAYFPFLVPLSPATAEGPAAITGTTTDKVTTLSPKNDR